MKRVLVVLLLVFGIILLTGELFAAPENLDEVFNRKARIPGVNLATLTPFLENASNYYIWQPETLNYEDIQTGHEVWRVTSFPAADYYRDIGFTAWSADGNRFGIVTMRNSQAVGSGRKWITLKTDGSFLRTISGAPSEGSTRFFHWSPQIPDTYYEFGASAGFSPYTLYKVSVSDTGVSSSQVLNYSSSHGALDMLKSISPDGTKIVAFGDLLVDGQVYEGWMYPSEVCEDGDLDIYGNELCDGVSAHLLDIDGYSSDRPWDCYWGNCSPSWASLHDQFMGGAGDDLWFYVMPENASGSWWRIRLTGSAADGGSSHIEDHTEPYDWGNEMQPLSAGSGNIPYCTGTPYTDPDCPGYFSHFVPDRWGRYALFTKSYGPAPGDSAGVYDIDNHAWVNSGMGGQSQHHGWNGWSDYVLSSAGTALTGNYVNDRIYAAKYNDSSSQFTVAFTHTRFNSDGTDSSMYESLTRPTQSPDGTKVAFASTFLNIDDTKPDLFWAVVYYPYPPIIIGASKIGNNVRLVWDPPQYTQRGWPNETTDEPPLPKEIKSYHVWMSSDGISWDELTTTGVDFKTWQYDINQPFGTMRYYAITSEEHSGLESRTLSNIWRVQLDSGGNIISSSEYQNYPVSPGAINTFYTKEPPSPTDVNVNQVQPGRYQLTWIEPIDSKIRYYNIYYSTSPDPQPIQQNKIASVPVGTDSYLDWLADTTLQGYYTITSVDRQGNEGVFGGVNYDVNLDGSINIKDLAIVIFNQGRSASGGYAHLDLDSDGNIDWDDAKIIIHNM